MPLLRKLFGRKIINSQELSRAQKTGMISSPEKICRYLGCPKDKVYFRRAWLSGGSDAPLERFDAFLRKDVKIAAVFGRSRATYRIACRSTAEGAPFIDAMMFGRWRGKKLVISVGPLDPLYYGESTMVYDCLCAEDDKALVDEICERFFSENSLKNKVHKVGQNGTKEVEAGKVSFDDVVLPEETKKLLRANSLHLLSQREIYKKNGIPLKRGIILEGPPGNGKTMVCKALASTGLFTVFWVTPSEYSNLHEVYEKAARQAPSIVLFEDIDLLGSSRVDNPKMLGQIMNAIDGLVEAEGVITIATTNDAEGLDKAMAHRPNRFDVRIRFENPGSEARLGMLRKFTERQKPGAGLDLPRWAQRSEGFSGAQIRELCYQAAKFALEAGRIASDQRAILSDTEFEKGMTAMKTASSRQKKAGFSV